MYTAYGCLYSVDGLVVKSIGIFDDLSMYSLSDTLNVGGVLKLDLQALTSIIIESFRYTIIITFELLTLTHM